MKSFYIFLVFFGSSFVFAEKFFTGLVEGDIATRDNDNSLDGQTQSAFLSHQSKTWDHGTVPYYIDEDSIRNQEHRDLIKDVIKDMEAAVKCISFLDLSGKEKLGDHIRIRAHGDSKHSGEGCWSYAGKQGGEQVVNLGQGCMEWGTITHEVLHALGQLHEQTRPDRDNHVEILASNIEHGKAHNFKKREKGSGPDQVAYLDASYDMYSLLHYPSTAWSKDKKSPTIQPINKLYKHIGGSEGMTATDKIELNLRYGCSDICTSVLVDYIHEVEYRGTMELKHMADKLTDIQEEMRVLKQGDLMENENILCDNCHRYLLTTTQTALECQTKCEEDNKCRYFVWHRHNGNKWENQCVAIEDSKDHVVEIKRAFDKNCVSGSARGFQEAQTLKQPLHASFCGYKSKFSKKQSRVTYDKLVSSSTNVWVHGTSKPFDISTGKFKVGIAGTYRIDHSLTAWTIYHDAAVYLHVRKNGIPLPETKHDSDNDNFAGIADQGGATILLQLEKDDIVDLFCTECTAGIGHVLFCVQLEHVDMAKALKHM